MTTSLRSLFGIVFAALLALSLIVTTTDAIAATRSISGGQSFLDAGAGTHNYFKPKPIGRFGITWE